MKGMLAPKTREVVLGMAECRNVIKIKSVGTIAGSYVKSGKIQRGASVRVIRDGIVIADDAIASLQRFKDAVKEVSEGYECGIGLEDSTISKRAICSRFIQSKNTEIKVCMLNQIL